MMPNKLYEFIPYESAKMVVESAEDGRNMCMRGIFIQGDVRNQNQRVYPVREISKAVNDIQSKISSGTSIMGEADHPEELAINLDRVSHLITEMWMDKSDGYGKLKILDTPMGRIIRTLLEANAKLGVSSRGSGNVGDSGEVSDFEIVTVDIVAQPSAPDAYPRTIYESLYNMKGGHQMYHLAEAAVHEPKANAYLQKDIISFIKDLKI